MSVLYETCSHRVLGSKLERVSIVCIGLKFMESSSLSSWVKLFFLSVYRLAPQMRTQPHLCSGGKVSVGDPMLLGTITSPQKACWPLANYVCSARFFISHHFAGVASAPRFILISNIDTS